MNPAIVIPSYWAGQDADAFAPGHYDHTTDPAALAPELDTCLGSLEKVRGVGRVIVLVVCPPAATDRVRAQVASICAAHPMLPVTVVTNDEAAHVQERIAHIAPEVRDEPVSLRGYGAIRNMGLAAAAVLGHDVVVFLDDDEVVLTENFMDEALHGLNQLTRQGLPILAKSGYFYDRAGSPFADTSRSKWCDRWWTKRDQFNRWMRRALATTRISRSNYVCGGCLALHARAFTRVAFDPYITRGEDLDYLFNIRMNGLDVWFDNKWVVRHLPPKQTEKAPRFLQNVYRWTYERAKLLYANAQIDLHQVTADSLMPYPGPWISENLESKVVKTCLARALCTREHGAYLRVLTRGRASARRYAAANCDKYVRFQNFWPAIMAGLWCDAELAALLERGSTGGAAEKDAAGAPAASAPAAGGHAAAADKRADAAPEPADTANAAPIPAPEPADAGAAAPAPAHAPAEARPTSQGEDA